ncbi:MAG: hypothetical protein LBT44_02055 [Clostridiales bacterium]|nr:hypothetical protein [Clostridiales bacterium]
MFLFLLWILRSVDIRTGKLLKAHVLYGTIENGMTSVKAAVRADYLCKTVRSGVFRPIPDNVHDLLFFPVAVEELNTTQVAIVTYNPWYPCWAQASIVFDSLAYENLKMDMSKEEYEGYARVVKCMIIGNGLFSHRPSDYELWYFKND